MNQNPSPSPIQEVSEATFEREVLGVMWPVLAVFWSTWSRPCAVLKPVLEDVAATCAGQTQVVRINADDNPTLSLWYDIQAIPTLLYFVNGTLRDRIVGTATQAAILAKLNQVIQGSKATVTARNPL